MEHLLGSGLVRSGGSVQSFVSEGTQTEFRARKGGRKAEKEREKEGRQRQKMEEKAEQYRKLSVHEEAYRRMSQQYEVGSQTLGPICGVFHASITYILQEEKNPFGMDNCSNEDEDDKADDMNEMEMPNPGSIQVVLCTNP